MYKILVIGDPHFKVNNLDTMREFSNKIKVLIGLKQFDFMVCLGDTLHSHNKMEQSCLKMAIDFFRQVASSIPVYIIIGNHDRPRENIFLTEDHPFHGLDNHANITIAWKVIDYSGEYGRVVFVPYVSPGRFEEALSTLDVPIEEDRPVVLFAHQEFKGSKNENGILSTRGDEWPLASPLVISGHIHEYQKLQENLIYIGTPVQHTFGESKDKAVGLLSCGKNGYSLQRMRLGLKTKRTIECKIEELAEIEIDEDEEVRLLISCKHNEMKAFEKTDMYKSLIKNNVKIQYKFIYDKTIESSNKSWLDLMKEKCNEEQYQLLEEIMS